jgi:holin-like protein
VSTRGQNACVLTGLTWLLVCQLIGEVLVRLTDAPVPGPVVGMVVLFVALKARWVDDGARALRAADTLIKHLQLLFVPAGVGIVVFLGTIRDQALPIMAALLLSWLIGLAVVGWLTVLLERALDRSERSA